MKKPKPDLAEIVVMSGPEGSEGSNVVPEPEKKRKKKKGRAAGPKPDDGAGKRRSKGSKEATPKAGATKAKEAEAKEEARGQTKGQTRGPPTHLTGLAKSFAPVRHGLACKHCHRRRCQQRQRPAFFFCLGYLC